MGSLIRNFTFHINILTENLQKTSRLLFIQYYKADKIAVELGGTGSRHVGDVEKLERREPDADMGIYGSVIFNKF